MKHIAAIALGIVALVGSPAIAKDSSQDGPKKKTDEAAKKSVATETKPVAPPRAGTTLTAEEITHYMTPYTDGIRVCYERHVMPNRKADGRVRIEMIIRRAGRVIGLKVTTPNVKSKQFEECVEDLATEWSFPHRRNRTAVALPFLFLRTRAPGSGPILSCWNPHGCSKKAPPAKARPSVAPAPEPTKTPKKATRAKPRPKKR